MKYAQTIYLLTFLTIIIGTQTNCQDDLEQREQAVKTFIQKELKADTPLINICEKLQQKYKNTTENQAHLKARDTQHEIYRNGQKK
jgi:RNase H-fold protein (predicted Holliday junction resolvase)